MEQGQRMRAKRSWNADVPAGARPGTVLVVPPREVLDDELRRARLESYLEAAFPDLAFTVATRNTLPGNQSAVGVLANPDGSNPFPEAETQPLCDRVLEAVGHFVDYGRRAH